MSEQGSPMHDSFDMTTTSMQMLDEMDLMDLDLHEDSPATKAAGGERGQTAGLAAAGIEQLLSGRDSADLFGGRAAQGLTETLAELHETLQTPDVTSDAHPLANGGAGRRKSVNVAAVLSDEEFFGELEDDEEDDQEFSLAHAASDVLSSVLGDDRMKSFDPDEGAVAEDAEHDDEVGEYYSDLHGIHGLSTDAATRSPSENPFRSLEGESAET